MDYMCYMACLRGNLWCAGLVDQLQCVFAFVQSSFHTFSNKKTFSRFGLQYSLPAEAICTMLVFFLLNLEKLHKSWNAKNRTYRVLDVDCFSQTNMKNYIHWVCHEVFLWKLCNTFTEKIYFHLKC